MAQITHEERENRIRELLNDLVKAPPERHQTERIDGVGPNPVLCDVIVMHVDEVLLNHRSHRVRAQLEDDPEWAAVSNDPFKEPAQKIIERYIRASRSEDEFEALRKSLREEGQTNVGVMTHTGVLINGNTRAVALRDLEDPAKRYIRVAVLPRMVQPVQLDLLELRLQMQKELKQAYSFTNELLFINELKTQGNVSEVQIARELRIFPESEKKGKNEVLLRLRMLDLIRMMQKIPTEPLRLTQFDSLKPEQMRDVLRKYDSLMAKNPHEAERYLQSFLFAVVCGVTVVHQIRKIDATFMGDHMLPQLEEDEELGELVPKLLEPEQIIAKSAPAGAGTLITDDLSDGSGPDLKHLINLVTRRDKRIELRGDARIILEQDDVKRAFKDAMVMGIRDKRRVEVEEDELEAPTEAVKNATQQVVSGVDALRAIGEDPGFDIKRRDRLEAAFKKFKRRYRDLEAALAKLNIISR